MRAQTASDDQTLDRAITNSVADVVEYARTRGELDAALDLAEHLADNEGRPHARSSAGCAIIHDDDGSAP